MASKFNLKTSNHLLRCVCATTLVATLAGCSGNSGDSAPGSTSAANGFSTPDDARAYVGVLLIDLQGGSFVRAPQTVSTTPTICSSGSRADAGSTTVSSPYTSSGTLSAEQFSYSACTDSSNNQYDGPLVYGESGDIVHLDLGDSSGAFVVHQDPSGSNPLIISALGTVDGCGSCKTIGSATSGAIQSTLDSTFEVTARSASLSVVEGDATGPLTLRAASDTPSSGQTSFFFDRAPVELKFSASAASCDLSAVYTSPDESMPTVDTTADEPVSGRTDIALGGDTAVVDFAAAGPTITVDGVAQTYTYDEIRSALYAACPGLQAAVGD